MALLYYRINSSCLLGVGYGIRSEPVRCQHTVQRKATLPFGGFLHAAVY